jgi:aspartate-semialdehyde dehydrogenase
VSAAAADEGRGGIVANPNCSTIQIAMAVAPLQRAFGLREVHVTTLQAVSGAGQKGVAELAAQIEGAASGGDAGDVIPPAQPGKVFPRRIAANAIPAIGPATDDGWYEEELKVRRELRKILDAGGLAVTCTATRVPVITGHAAACRVICRRKVAPDEAVAAMRAVPGMKVDPQPSGYRTPAEIAGDMAVHVGRVRQDPDRQDTVIFWVVADNLLKGAALNAVQIAEGLARQLAEGSA